MTNIHTQSSMEGTFNSRKDGNNDGHGQKRTTAMT